VILSHAPSCSCKSNKKRKEKKRKRKRNNDLAILPSYDISKILKAPLPDTVLNPIIVNEKLDNAIYDCKTDNLLEAPVTPTGRPKHTLNPSLKAHEILEGKAIVLVEDLD